MTSSLSILTEAASAANRLGRHPQDHGWRELYRLFALGMEISAPRLSHAARAFRLARPSGSYSHLVTLLGIAIKRSAPGQLERLVGNGAPELRLELLEQAIDQHWEEIEYILSKRQNSFTTARRFLLPQVLLGAYFAGKKGTCNFADLGTGLGILPRQLNSQRLYTYLASDLTWPGGIPSFQEIKFGMRWGIDRGPMPDLSWVRACHGSSTYYDGLYDELLMASRDPDVQCADVAYQEIDLLDTRALSTFIDEKCINAVNICYVLYQFEPNRRHQIVENLLNALHDPGFMIVTEPRAELTQPGCTVHLYDRIGDLPWELCTVSDGHFRGAVSPLLHYEDFTRHYPIHLNA